MKIKKYIISTDLLNFNESLEYLVESEYCLQNYDEEGNRTTIEIYKDHIELALSYIKSYLQDENFIQELQNLVKFFEEYDIDFIKVN